MPAVRNKEKLLSVSQAAKLVGVSSETLRRWDEKGILVSQRTRGGQRRYSRQILLDFLRQKRPAAELISPQPTVPLRKELLTVSEAAKLVGVSPETLRRWDKKNFLPSLRTRGDQRRYRKEDLLALTNQKKTVKVVFQPEPKPQAEPRPLSYKFLLIVAGFSLLASFLSGGLVVSFIPWGKDLKLKMVKLMASLEAQRFLAETPEEEALVLGEETTPLIAAALETTSVNLLRNVSFETGNVETKTGQNQFGQPKLWDYSRMAHQDNIYVSDESIRSGTLALKVEDRAASAPMPLGFSQPSVTTRNGTDYNLSAFLRTKNLVGNPKLRIGFKGTASTADPHYGSARWAKYSADKYQDFSLSTIRPTTWTQFSFIYENAALGKYPFFEIIDYQGGQIFFDDLQLTEGKQSLLAHQEGTILGDGTLLADSWSNFYPYTDNQGSVGSTTKRFANVYAYGLDLENDLSVGGVASSLSPNEDDTHDLGTTENRWNNLFLDGTAHVDAIILNGNFTLSDDDWIGLGADAGRIVFDDQATDEISILAADLALGDNTNFDNPSAQEDLFVEGNLEVEGTIYGSVSGSVDLDFTEGSVTFIDSSGALAQDNANFFWDDTNDRLGVGTTSPSNKLSIAGGVGIGTTSPTSVYHSTSVAPDGGLIIEGNVGIGTTTPEEALHVAGNSFIGGDIILETGASRNIYVQSPGFVGNDGDDLIIQAADGNGSPGFPAAGGDLFLYPGSGAGGDDPGNVILAYTGSAEQGVVMVGKSTLLVVDDEDLIISDEDSHGEVIIESVADGFDPRLGFALVNKGSSTTTFSLGIDHSDSDKFKIGTSDLETNTRLTIDADGNVGIGTTLPSNKLSVAGGVGIGTTSPTSTYHTTGVAPDGGLIVEGNVGIGITGPGAVLDLYKDSPTANQLIFRIGTSGDSSRFTVDEDGDVNADANIWGLRFIPYPGSTIASLPSSAPAIAAVSNDLVLASRVNSSNDIRLVTNDGSTVDTRMLIEGTGLVSIGVEGIVTPEAHLEVQVNDNDNVAALLLDMDDVTNNPNVLEIANAGTGNAVVIDTDEFVITGAGNVGIGTTAPGEILDIEKSQNASTRIEINNTNSGGSAYAGLKIASEGGSGFIYRTSDAYTFDESPSDSLIINEAGGGEIAFMMGTTDVMRIDSSGNVGIGTTSPIGKLHVSNGASGQGAANTSLDELVIENNANAGVSILTPNSNIARYGFGDPEDSYMAGLEYDNSLDLLSLQANNIDTFYISSSGNVSIGTGRTSPSNKLSVAGGVGIGTTSPTSDYHTTGVAPDGGLIVEGSVGVGTTSPGIQLDVVGNARFSSVGSDTLDNDLGITADGTLTTDSSDISMKTNLVNLEGSLEKITQLQGYYFNWVEDPERNRKIGMIAQEVAQVIPEVTFTNQIDGKMGINYSKLTTVLAEGIKEQQLQLEELEIRLDEVGNPIMTEEGLSGTTEPLQDTAEIALSLDNLTGELAAMNERVDFLEAMLLDPDWAGQSEASPVAEFNFEDSSLEEGERLEIESDLVIHAGLNVLGETIVADLGVTGKLTTGLLTIDGLTAEINSLAEPLKLQSLALGEIEMMGGKVQIDTKGNVNVSEGVIAGNDSFRGAIVVSEEALDESQIRVAKEWESAPASINLTPTWETQIWVKELDDQGFTVHFSSLPQEEDRVYWLAVW